MSETEAKRVYFCVAVDPDDREGSIKAITEAVIAAMKKAGIELPADDTDE